MKLITCAILLSTVSGCLSPEVTWHGDSRFTAEERQAIESGEAWLASHAGRAPATFNWTYRVTSDYRLPGTIRRERGPDGGKGISGLCAGSTIYLDPVGLPEEEMRPEYLPGLAAHEMAHCELGFADGYHDTDAHTDGIMRVLYPMRWTAAEDAQCAHVNAACGPR